MGGGGQAEGGKGEEVGNPIEDRFVDRSHTNNVGSRMETKYPQQRSSTIPSAW